MEDLQTLATLGTTVGAAAATLVIVQYVKPMLPKVDTRLMVLILAILFTQIFAIFTNAGDWPTHLIALINGFTAATSAMGTYEVTFKKSDVAKKEAKLAAEEDG